jgi:hypothetical protein
MEIEMNDQSTPLTAFDAKNILQTARQQKLA